MKIKDIMLCGIYIIINLYNGRVYIGQSKNIYNRWTTHIKDLECKIHINRPLQDDYIEFGPSAFEFLVLEECGQENLSWRESDYIADFKYRGSKLYNNNVPKNGYDDHIDFKLED